MTGTDWLVVLGGVALPVVGHRGRSGRRRMTNGSRRPRTAARTFDRMDLEDATAV